MDSTWGFEEDDEESEVEVEADEQAEEPLLGKDPDEIVTIAVTDTADVLSVHIDEQWRERVEAHLLGGKVVEAMNAATIIALARQSEQVDMTGSESAGTTPPPETSESIEDERPITMEDAMRLLHAVKSDLATFTHQLSAVRNRAVAVESGGDHVTVSGARRQVATVELDQTWLHSAPNSEIESETRDALTAFITKSTPDEQLTQGPQSSAITELKALVADPQTLIRRINKRSTS